MTDQRLSLTAVLIRGPMNGPDGNLGHTQHVPDGLAADALKGTEITNNYNFNFPTIFNF